MTIPEEERGDCASPQQVAYHLEDGLGPNGLLGPYSASRPTSCAGCWTICSVSLAGARRPGRRRPDWARDWAQWWAADEDGLHTGTIVSHMSKKRWMLGWQWRV